MSDVITLDGLGYGSCSRSLVLQSIRFDRKKWTARRARAWLKRKKKRAGKLDATANQLRFRQKQPSSCVRGSFRSITLGKGISAISCCPRRK